MTEAKRPLKVFLSYARSDKDEVRELYLRLKNDGVDAWLDKENILPGQDWELEIRKAVREADVVVVCLSKQFNQAGFRQKEVRLALDTAMEKPEGEIFIIPARLEECETLESLRKWNWVDLFDRDGYEKLLRAIKLRDDQLEKSRIRKDEAIKRRLPYFETPAARNNVLQQKTENVSLQGPSAGSELSDVTERYSHNQSKNKRPIKTEYIVAFIGAIATIIAGILSSPWIATQFSPAPVATEMTTPIFTLTAQSLTPIPITDTPTVPLTPASSLDTHTEITSSTNISLLDSFPAPGIGAEGLTWDGTSLWVSDNSGTIFKLDATGKPLDSFASPEVTPQGMTWDGSSFWVFTTNYFIYQFQVVDGKARTLNSFRSPAEVAGGGLTQDMAWDGESLWFANQFKVFNLDRAGNVLSSFTFSKNVTGLDWDGSNLWVAFNDFPENASWSIVNTAGEILDTNPALVYEVNGLAWAGDYVWVLGRDSLGGDAMIYKIGVTRK